MKEQRTDDRVLGRRGARILSENECGLASGSIITGGRIITAPCTFNAKTCTMDGICEVPVRCPSE
jgi:hypothetical protein